MFLVLLTGSRLCLSVLALLRQRRTFGAVGRDLGLQLGQIADRRPVLGFLGQELILAGSEVGQLGAEIALRAR
jgi:hypothetical protein